jgi:hypothetical protein
VSEFLAEVRDLSIDWPGKSVRLQRDSLSDHWQLPVSPQPAIAELYHENSKLFAGIAASLAAGRTDVPGLRTSVMAKRSAALATSDWRAIEPPAAIRRAVEAALAGLPDSTLYAFELRLLWETTLAIFEPLRKAVYHLDGVAQDELDKMADALGLLGERPSRAPDSVLLFVVASFARNQILYGARGYRRTLVEGGRIAEHLLGRAAAAGLVGRLWLEFGDRRIDDLVEVDGIEEGTIAVIEIGAMNHADQR